MVKLTTRKPPIAPIPIYGTLNITQDFSPSCYICIANSSTTTKQTEQPRPFDIINLLSNNQNVTQEKPLLDVATPTEDSQELPVTQSPVHELPVYELPVYELLVPELPVSELQVTELPVPISQVTELPVPELPIAQLQEQLNQECIEAPIENNLNHTNNDLNSSNIVLNVPVLNFRKQEISTIDIATKKRKLYRLKRQTKRNASEKKNKEKKVHVAYEKIKTHTGIITNFGVNVHGYSDSSSSSSYVSSDYESECEHKLQRTSKVDDSRKLTFMNIFDLTTLRNRNALELKVLKKRKWTPRWKLPPKKTNKPANLNLPVPCKSASTLRNSPDYYLKANFFNKLELQKKPLQKSHEYETIWSKVIIKERLRRNCDLAVIPYSQKFYEENFSKHFKIDERLNKQSENLQNQNPVKDMVPQVESLVKMNNNRMLAESNCIETADYFKVKSKVTPPSVEKPLQQDTVLQRNQEIFSFDTDTNQNPVKDIVPQVESLVKMNNNNKLFERNSCIETSNNLNVTFKLAPITPEKPPELNIVLPRKQKLSSLNTDINQNPVKDMVPQIKSLDKVSSNNNLFERKSCIETSNNLKAKFKLTPATPEKPPELDTVLPKKQKLSSLHSDKTKKNVKELVPQVESLRKLSNRNNLFERDSYIENGTNLKVKSNVTPTTPEKSPKQDISFERDKRLSLFDSEQNQNCLRNMAPQVESVIKMSKNNRLFERNSCIETANNLKVQSKVTATTPEKSPKLDKLLQSKQRVSVFDSQQNQKPVKDMATQVESLDKISNNQLFERNCFIETANDLRGKSKVTQTTPEKSPKLDRLLQSKERVSIFDSEQNQNPVKDMATQVESLDKISNNQLFERNRFIETANDLSAKSKVTQTTPEKSTKLDRLLQSKQRVSVFDSEQNQNPVKDMATQVKISNNNHLFERNRFVEAANDLRAKSKVTQTAPENSPKIDRFLQSKQRVSVFDSEQNQNPVRDMATQVKISNNNHLFERNRFVETANDLRAKSKVTQTAPENSPKIDRFLQSKQRVSVYDSEQNQNLVKDTETQVKISNNNHLFERNRFFETDNDLRAKNKVTQTAPENSPKIDRFLQSKQRVSVYDSDQNPVKDTATQVKISNNNHLFERNRFVETDNDLRAKSKVTQTTPEKSSKLDRLLQSKQRVSVFASEHNQNPAKDTATQVQISNNNHLFERNRYIGTSDDLKVMPKVVPLNREEPSNVDIASPRNQKLCLLESDKNKTKHNKRPTKKADIIDITSTSDFEEDNEEEGVHPIDLGKAASTQTSSNMVLPVTMILVDNRIVKDNPSTKNEIRRDRNVQCVRKQHTKNGLIKQWPGIQNVANTILESYVSYCQTYEREETEKKETVNHLKRVVKRNEKHSKILDCKLTSVKSTATRLKLKGIQLQKKVDYFYNIVNAFR